MKKIGCIVTLTFVLASGAVFAKADKTSIPGTIAVTDSLRLKKRVKMTPPANASATVKSGAAKTGIPGPNGVPRKVSTYQDLKKTPPVKDTVKKIGH